MTSPPSDELLDTYAPLLPVGEEPGLCAHQATDFFALWSALEKASGTASEVPFWGVVWPGARLLIRFIAQNRNLFRGKTLYDIGSGCGIAAIAAARAGSAEVVANDIDPVALYMCRKNCEANGVKVRCDPRNLVLEPSCPRTDIVLVADLFYELSFASSLCALLRRMREKGTEVFIADAGRPFTPRTGIEKLFSAVLRVDEAIEGRPERHVTLYRFTEG